MKSKSILIALLLVGLFAVASFVDATFLAMYRAGSNNYVESFTGRYFCSENVDVYVRYLNDQYGGYAFSVKYSGGNESITVSNRSTVFPTVGLSDNQYDYYNFRNSYSVDRASDTNIGLTGIDMRVFRLNVKSLSKNTTHLDFVDSMGNLFDANNQNQTLSVKNGSINIATHASGVTINYEACPCTNDSNKPTTGSLWWTGSNGKQVKDGKKRALGVLTLGLLVNDRNTSSSWHTGFNSDTKTINNYVAYNGDDMDNQVGVDKSSIKMKLIYSGVYGNQSDEILEFNNGLSVSDHEGDGSKYTWNHNVRGYDITGATAVSLQVEKPVTVEIYAKDLGLQGGSVCWFDPNGSDFQPLATYTFNTGSDPWISASSLSNQNPDVKVSFTVKDDWIGVNSGTITLEILDVTSGSKVLWTGGIFSGDDLNVNCHNDMESLGGQGPLTCDVSLKNHLDFPTKKTINLIGSAQDFLGKTGSKSWTIGIRQDCSEITGCYNPLVVNLWSGALSQWAPALEKAYTGTNVVVTGTIAPYPYLTGDSGNVLMCGPIETTINLEGIVIYDNEGHVISTETGYVYSQDSLYVTGLDYSYEGKDGNNENYGLVTIGNNN